MTKNKPTSPPIIDPLDRGEPSLPMPLDKEWLRANNLLPEQWKKKEAIQNVV